MNGFEVPKSHWFVLCVCAIVWVGCEKEESSRPQPPPGDTVDQLAQPILQTGPTGEMIIENLIARYSNARSYTDQAVLYLSYRLQGRSIQEPQRWATKWDHTGRLGAQWFNGIVRCNGELLSCYVYDIESENLDNQNLLMPYDNQLPINQLFRDSIAKHFLGGYSELPLDETDLDSAPKLIPPPISLLTNQVRNGWLQNPSRLERLADQTAGDKTCFVVRCLSQGMTADVWIDQQDHMLVQMSLPLKLLAGEVITSPEITEVVLMAKFHDAVLDGQVSEQMFSIEPRPEATPVLKYVALPETFPSELIGKTAPDFNLVTEQGESRKRLFFDGKVTALLWLAGRPSYSAIGQLDALAAELPAEKFHVASVYSDSELASPGSSSLQTVEELASAIRSARIPSYYDAQLLASRALRVKTIPSVIVLDGDSKIQFARALSDESWLTDVKAVLERVAAGDDVAGEMVTEYQRFLDSYHQQLLTVSAAELNGAQSGDSQVSIDRNIGRPSIRLRPEKAWVNREFKQAGNVSVLEDCDSDQSAYLIFDGWRTVVQIDTAGQTKSRVDLRLPDGEAANLIRQTITSNRDRLFAVFSKLGKNVFLFDGEWNPIGTYPGRDIDHAGILDCRFLDSDVDARSELIISFDDENGIHQVDTITLEGEKIATAVASSMVSLDDHVVISGQGKIGMLKTGLTSVEETELQFRRICAFESEHICGLGMTDDSQWQAVGFDEAFERVWTLSIGSQFFESEIEPIAVTRSRSGEIIWAIADTDDVVHLVSAAGKWLGDFQSESRLGGIALATRSGQTCLIISNANGIECWNLNLLENPIRPVSTRK